MKEIHRNFNLINCYKVVSGDRHAKRYALIGLMQSQRPTLFLSFNSKLISSALKGNKINKILEFSERMFEFESLLYL